MRLSTIHFEMEDDWYSVMVQLLSHVLNVQVQFFCFRSSIDGIRRWQLQCLPSIFVLVLFSFRLLFLFGVKTSFLPINQHKIHYSLLKVSRILSRLVILAWSTISSCYLLILLTWWFFCSYDKLFQRLLFSNALPLNFSQWAAACLSGKGQEGKRVRQRAESGAATSQRSPLHRRNQRHLWQFRLSCRKFYLFISILYQKYINNSPQNCPKFLKNCQ